MIIDQLFTRPLFEQAPMASPEQLAYNKLRAQYDSYQAMTSGGGNTAVSRDPAHAAKLATVPAEIARMAAALKAKGIDAEAQYDALGGPKAAPVDANQAYGGISEAIRPGVDTVASVKKLWQYINRNLTDLASNASFEEEHSNQPYIEDRLADLLKTADGDPVTIAFDMGGNLEFDNNVLYVPVGNMWRYRGLIYGADFVKRVVGFLSKQNMAEGSDQQLSVRQLATISDEALDKAYGYGRSSPGNTFGWQANLKSAAYAKHMIDKGVTDIDEIADAIHKGWNVTAKAFVKNPNRFDDTEKLKAAGKLEAKLQQRAKLMNIDYSQLPDDEQEKDRVVARALLQAITGGGEQGMSEGEYDSRKPFGVRYKVFAGREGRMTTREYWTSSEEKLQRAVDKIQALDNFYEIDGYSYPKESQGVAKGLSQTPFTDEELVAINQYLDDDLSFQELKTYPGLIRKIATHFDITSVQGHSGEMNFYDRLVQAREEGDIPQQGVAEGLTEMDKSQTPPGRDGSPRPGPDREAKPITAKKATRDAGRMLNRAVKDSYKKKDVKESDALMIKLRRAMVKEGRVKELADDLKTMPDTDFMKKYGKAKAAIRKDMKRVDEARSDYTPDEMADMLSGKRSQKQIDADAERTRGPNKAPPTKESTQSRAKRLNEKLATSDTLSRPAASASLSGKAIDDPDIMGSLKSASTPKFDRFSKTDSEPKIDFRAGLVGGEPEVEAEPRLMVDPLPDMQKWGGKFATGSAGGDNRFTAPAGWRYVEKDEDPARYGSAPAAAAAGGGLPDLKYDPQSRTLKSADALALDLSPKSKFKFDRATQSQVPVDGSGANPNIDNATRDRARAYAARQNAPVDAAKKKVDWKTIYALNKATIGTNPNLIRPGMKLKMPDGSTYPVQPGDNLSKIAAKQSQINELSTNKLAQYKTAAAKDAKEADKEGDFKRGDKRFGGIVQATKKQFDNDTKKVDESRAARRALMARIVNS